MLIFTPQALAFVAVPKTGTTAIEKALRPHADILFRKSQKHTSAQRFHRRIRPFVRATFDTSLESFAVLREPEDQIRSWYKYRCRDEIRDKPEYAGQLSFNDYVDALLSDSPPPCAQIGSQYRMLSGRGGRIIVDHLFAYERWDQLEAFLTDRFGHRINFEPHNVSPYVKADLSPQLRSRLRAARPAEFDLHARLMAADGKLRPRQETKAV
ncbi:hypothetical protein [Tritonibacter mobilis]|uniref:hypothetical protein n=1 Tax=Tritonibacter mobilis TaxID=379347 RepID=UPI001401FBE9|nr:hypothetical protein [Tritonibacter mobilis]NHM20677.1 hypothetical protein [Tritonibacter mobilis]NHM24830.1 hypothetical protein [Tritonibacter mobilis]